MNDNITDPSCSPSIFDTTLFPTGSTLANNPNYSILPFLCQVVNAATNPNIDPVLVTPPPYDWSPHLNFSALTGVGDPRYSDGAILSACFTEFLPKIITQLEVKKAGGSKVVNGYACDSDGNPIYTKTQQPITTTVGNGNINLYGYPIGSVTNEQLMEPITEQSIASFYTNFIQNQQALYANAFVYYIINAHNPSAYDPSRSTITQNGWNATLHSTTVFPLFYVQLDYLNNGNVTNTVYLKYHSDSQQAVLASLINSNYISPDSTINVQPTMIVTNNVMIRMSMSVIPDYTKLDDYADIASKSADSFSATPSDDYTNQYNTFASNPSAYKA